MAHLVNRGALVTLSVPTLCFTVVATSPTCHASDRLTSVSSLSVLFVFSDDCLWSEHFPQLPGLARSRQQCSHQSDGWWLCLNHLCHGPLRGGRLQSAPSAGGSRSLKSARPVQSQPGRDYACSSLLIRLLGLTRHAHGIRTLPLAGMWPGERPTAKTVLSALHIQKVMGDTGLSCFVLRTSCPG